jgi:tetratricopeptide (TPR) repeat protein
VDGKRPDNPHSYDETIAPSSADGEPRRPSVAELPTLAAGSATPALAATGIDATGETMASSPAGPPAPVDATGETMASAPGAAPARPGVLGREPVHGDKLDHFTVLERLGAGGMGVVLAAYDPDLDRKVAIKLLRPDVFGADSEAARLRLLREAQAMAKLNHPNVITVHEVGVVDDRVFVAMEYVDGGTLRGKDGAPPPPWRETLDRYVQAGRGLAAAHRADLVHRDFKPENVLVGRDGRVRVTDFGLVGMIDDAKRQASAGTPPSPPATPATPATGVAAAITGSRPSLSDLTRTGSIMGTPAYMAPEQHAGKDVDARADQFAFCVALHEGLYGRRPFAGRTYQELVANVMAGTIVAPPADADVPGWLRAVVLRGLSTDPDRRYPDMVALLDDLAYDRRHARRRTLAVVAGFVAVSGVAGVALLRGGDDPPRCQGAREQLAGAWDATIAGRVAGAFAGATRPATVALGEPVRAATEAYAGTWAAQWTDACEATHVRGNQTGAVLDLRMRCLDRRRNELAALTALWTGADAAVDGTLDRAVDAAAALVSPTRCADLDSLTAVVALPEDAAVRARIAELDKELATIRSLDAAGHYQVALPRARAAADAAAGIDYAPLRAAAILEHANLLDKTGAREGAKTAYRSAATEGGRAADDEIVATAWIGLATIHLDEAHYDLAEELLTLATAAVARTGDDIHLRRELANLRGTLLLRQGKNDAARAALEESVALHEQSLGKEHPGTARVLGNTAVIYLALGDVERSRALLTEVLAIEEKVYGQTHAELVGTLNNLAKTYSVAGQPADAKPLMERALAIATETLGAEHPDVGVFHDNLGIVTGRLGDVDAARAHHERAIAIGEKAQGPDHPDTSRARQNLAQLEKDAGNFARARELLERALAAYERTLGAEHPAVATMLGALANVLAKQGEAELARARYERAIAMQERLLGKDHPDLASTLNDYGTALEGEGRLAEAASQYQRALAIWEKAFGADNPNLSIVLTNLGSIANRQRRYRDAIAHCERVNQLDVAALGADHPDVAYSLLCLGIATLGDGKVTEAVALLERALVLREGKTSADAEAEARFELARALWPARSARPRARELAETARRQFADSGPGFTRQLDEVTAWLAER